MLSGWEVKSLRMGKGRPGDSYVLVKGGEAWLLGSQIVPLDTASTHFVTGPTRTRKLLLQKRAGQDPGRHRPEGPDLRLHPAVLERPPGESPPPSPRAKKTTTSGIPKKTATGARSSGWCGTTSTVGGEY